MRYSLRDGKKWDKFQSGLLWCLAAAPGRVKKEGLLKREDKSRNEWLDLKGLAFEVFDLCSPCSHLHR